VGREKRVRGAGGLLRLIRLKKKRFENVAAKKGGKPGHGVRLVDDGANVEIKEARRDHAADWSLLDVTR